jgi:hypothetical protein
MAKILRIILATIVGLLAGFGTSALQAGFRTPESLVRNVYGYYGSGAAELSHGLAHDTETAHRFFDPSLRGTWSSVTKQPYDFFVQSQTWKLGGISISILRRQYDKTYVAAAFANNGRPVTLNFILVNGDDGWLITDVESPHDSLRAFLAQYKN